MSQTIKIQLPTLHPDQVKAFRMKNRDGTPARKKAIRCGRRWGKTELGATIAVNGAIKKQSIGWFSPQYKFLSECYELIKDILEPVTFSASKMSGVIRTTTGGRVDFWSLDNERAGRSRKYHKVIIDEAAFAKNTMMDIWEKSIEPTLLDYSGSAIVLSNTNGVDSRNFFWRICNEASHGFVEYHAPSYNNPHVPQQQSGESEAEYIRRREQIYEELKAKTHPLVYAQEYLAEFVDWSGVAFFGKDKLLVNNEPAPRPAYCDAIYVTIDTATKTGKEHDGTAAVFWAITEHNAWYPLIIADWEIAQIQGNFLEAWLPSVFRRGEELAREYGAIQGFIGAWIEDKNSGSILLQQAANRTDSRGRPWPAFPIESKLTELGKDERALDVSGYVYQEKVKLSECAFRKVSIYKEQSRNHLLAQVTGYRIGAKDPDREDDLLDCFTYGIAIGLGNAEGF